jgi:hypothetical protein
LDGPLPKLCQAVALSRQDGNHSEVALLLKAALIQVSDYRLLGASGFFGPLGSIFSNSSHLEWRAGLSDTNLKGTHPGTIPARFGLIWFSSFRGEDLNAIFYQNMPNLHNRYISAERKISQKNPKYMLNYFLPCSCS